MSDEIAMDAAATAEGEALVHAALAGCGFDPPMADQEEIRKRLETYPGEFRSAREYELDNSVGPSTVSTPAIPRGKRT